MSNELKDTINWIPRTRGQRGLPAGLSEGETVIYRLKGCASEFTDQAGELNWRDGPGEIECYARLVPATAGVGDVNDTAEGTAARFNAGKPRLELIPAGLILELHKYRGARGCRPPARDVDWLALLDVLDTLQMASGGRDVVLAALDILAQGPVNLWAEIADVFDYGQKKYSAWNWARGQAWSIPIGSALRHLVLGVLQGEAIDPESGLPHRGHIGCNLVMLWWFMGVHPKGDDRFVPPLN